MGAAQILATVEPSDLARLGRLREVPSRLVDAAETFEAAHMPADALCNWPSETWLHGRSLESAPNARVTA